MWMEIIVMVPFDYEKCIILKFSLACNSNCASCTSSTVCQTCKSGFGLQSDMCSTCPTGTYLSGQTCIGKRICYSERVDYFLI